MSYTPTTQQDPEAGKVTATVQSGPISPDYLGFSIFTCLCCFWCVGIPALVKSVSTRDANARGDPNAAAYSREALLLNKIALGIGIAMHLIWIIILIAVVATGAAITGSVLG